MIPFPKTKADRTANDDPRPSLEERYPTHEAYVNAARTAANDLEAQRLLLDEDVQAYVQRAEASASGRQTVRRILEPRPPLRSEEAETTCVLGPLPRRVPEPT